MRVGGNTSEEAYFRAGDPIWVDVNGDYVIDEKDRVIVGNSRPRVTGGFSLNLRYKAFSINTNTSFTLRRDIINKALADRFASYGNPLTKSLEKEGAMVPIDAYNFWTPDNRYGRNIQILMIIRVPISSNRIVWNRPYLWKMVRILRLTLFQ